MNRLTFGLAGGAVLLAPLILLGNPAVGRPVAVVASPWASPLHAVEMISRADGRLLRSTALPWVSIAVFEEPDFVSRLWRLGAWLTVDAATAEACFRSIQTLTE